MSDKQRVDWFGVFVGFITFAGGIAALAFTFKMAFDLFGAPPETAIGTVKGQAIDLAKAGENLTTLGFRIILLLVMGLIGSTIASRGIKLYISARALSAPKPEVERAEVPEPTVS